jgi:site-specific DNA recombinase
MAKKRTWVLYRVSSKKQVNVDDDIPTQKIECHKFIKSHPDWEITNELYEKGKSGWSLKADERDEIVKLRDAAKNKEFDVLVVFMFDRIGRRDDESPFIVQFLVEQGVEVWSVKEGQAKFEVHVDKLLNYLRFWQASGESDKTSIRVKTDKANLAEQGYPQGGPAPYGYKSVLSDKPHLKKKGVFYNEEVPDEIESDIVKLIFNLYVNYHYGYRKICDHLNSKGYRSRNDNLFGVSSIQRILENPVYIGRKRYKSFRGKEGDTLPYKEELRIISDELFEKAVEIKNRRKEALHRQDKANIPLSGKLLLSGLAFCEVCGTRVSGNYIYRGKTPIYRYRCPANNGTFNHEQNMWGAKKFDQIVISMIKEIMRKMDISVFVDFSIVKKKEDVKSNENLLKSLKKEEENLRKQLEKLENEIIKALDGKSSFTAERLSTVIDNTESKLNKTLNLIEGIENELAVKKENFSEVRNLAAELENWEEKFDQADDDLKKVMLSRVINKVYFGKQRVNIEFNDSIEEVYNLIVEGN